MPPVLPQSLSGPPATHMMELDEEEVADLHQKMAAAQGWSWFVCFRPSPPKSHTYLYYLPSPVQRLGLSNDPPSRINLFGNIVNYESDEMLV